MKGFFPILLCYLSWLLAGTLLYGPEYQAFLDLKKACRLGDLQGAQAVFSSGLQFNPAGEENICLWTACVWGHEDLVRLLLTDPRVSPTEPGNRPIRMAARNGQAGIVRLLLATKEMDVDGINEAFRLACKHGFIDILKITLEDPRVNVNLRCLSSPRYTCPLNMACGAGDIEIVKLLLDDPRLELPAKFMESPFCEAAPYPEIIKVLLKDGRASPGASSSKALLKATAQGFIQTVRLLLAHPDVDPGANFSAVLGLAIDRGMVDIARLLLRHPKNDHLVLENIHIKALGGYLRRDDVMGSPEVSRALRTILKLIIMHPRVSLYNPNVMAALPDNFQEHRDLLHAIKTDQLVDGEYSSMEVMEWILVYLAQTGKSPEIFADCIGHLVSEPDWMDWRMYPVLSQLQGLMAFSLWNASHGYILPRETVMEISSFALHHIFHLTQ